jgi:sulfonate transport system substrate-binding protein
MKFVRTLVAAAGCVVCAALFLSGVSPAADRVVTVGFQKYGNLILLKGRGGLESRLAPLGFRVEWREFPSGPPLLEALNAGAIDFGQTGETPPIFAQAAGVPLVYAGYEPPAPQGEAILVPKDSSLKTLTEKADLKYSEIEPIYLAPADGRAAFERGAVDAWVIWDPFLAAAETATDARKLVDATGLAWNRQFYLASQQFADANPAAVDAILAAVADLGQWAAGKDSEVANKLSAGIGIPAPVLEIALKRLTYGVRPLDAEVVADQQRIADTFFNLGLVPKQIVVSSVVRKPAS